MTGQVRWSRPDRVEHGEEVRYMATSSWPIDAATIDEAYCPVPRSNIHAVDVGDETVLIDGWDQAVVLNPAGAMIWDRLDSATTISALAAELARDADVDADEVARDVVRFVERLGANGLLEGYAITRTDDESDVVLVPMAATRHGSVVANVEGINHHRQPQSLIDPDGGHRVAVKWNPNCGYCAAIAKVLHDLRAPLASNGIDLVLVVAAEIDPDHLGQTIPTRSSGSDLPTLLVTSDSDPFPGVGTPSAYHIDGEGIVVSPTAHGADEVPELLAQLAGITLDSHTDDDGNTVRYLRRRGGMCATDLPAAAGRWEASRVYRIGDYHVGVRVDSEQTGAILDLVFPGVRVDDDRAGFTYLLSLPGAAGWSPAGSAAEAGPDGAMSADEAGGLTNTAGGARALNTFVATGSVSTLRSRNPRRVVEAFLNHLDDEIGTRELAIGSVRVMARALVIDGTAMVFPWSIDAFAPRLQAELARRGAAMVDVPRPIIDLCDGALVVPSPEITHDPAVVYALGECVKASLLELPPVPPGRYPLRTWYVLRQGSNGVTALTPAEAAAATVSFVADTDDPAMRVKQLGDLFSQGPTAGLGLWYHSEPSFFEALGEALSWPGETRHL